jgi:phosphatidylglycerol---prolipoprotein diacylglyceryl transferase
MQSSDFYQSYQLIIDSGSRSIYVFFVLLSVILGGYFILKDSQEWAVDNMKKQWFFRFIGLCSLFGAAIPAYFAGGWVEQLTWDSLIGPKTVLGGVLFCCFSALIYKKVTNFDIETGDAFARGGCLMLLLGRIGCIAQHCCFGVEVPAHYGFDFGDGRSRFPVQAVEAFGLFILFVVLHMLHKRNYLQYKRLYVFFMFYGALRFFLEFYREQIANIYWGIGFYQWIALFISMIGVIQYIRVIKYLHDKKSAAQSMSKIPIKGAYSF